MSNENNQGYVYILTNPSFREDWVKIGKSSRPVDVRSKELDNTAVPLPFEIYATLKTAKYDKVEKQIHKQIDRLTDLRIRQNREFFNIAPSVALDIMRDIADLLEDAELAVYVEGKPVVSSSKDEDKKINAANEDKKRKKVKPAFKFQMVGLNVGDTIIFDATHLPVKIATDDKIEYEGRLWSLSAFTAEFLPEEMQNTSGTYQGPKYFSYGG
ncbi:MAG: GIY-YIG nuclease family protein [Bacteroidaceae bacterium]|nr:GIY-YIG nuclease family protein [Bacteroidaceae bacterium]